jgi:hypothetical protein
MPDLAPARRRHRSALVALLGAILLLLVAVPDAGAVHAAPALPAHAPGDPDDEGGTAKLRDQLDAASKGWLDAKGRLARSEARQKELAAHLATLETELSGRSAALGSLAGAAYRAGRLTPMAALLNSDSPDGFLDRAAALQSVAANEDRALSELFETREQESRAKAAIEGEILEQRKQVATMQARKVQAERALQEAARAKAAPDPDDADSDGPTGSSSGGGTAKPAPRNSDGSLGSQSCSINDPTTSGCITPRLLHALNQARAAGYTRYVSCYRSGGSGEHPKGRACDFAAAKGGFEGDATGGDRTYGNNLASYFIRNADALGVLYVIWYRQIWLPSSGWKYYSGAGGDPSSDHTNHVHLSVV